MENDEIFLLFFKEVPTIIYSKQVKTFERNYEFDDKD